ncbi:Nucleotide-binding universal stress protein, UspA family [Sporobacter termitidis DSM 10068]|uniref:Nucleotide-binding universal stress protein, UspA family n=1 Tax=Sporobacter termitidis DSM 10068 TaxID=1123282 RepID=A0A1M5YE00_9FIRM|nr:universal stress protein [Sporobacter termitidis]SHI10257.1 Nucleotide-binding universal stress protein, UspA family [Sporobacter termitidis DSM 10068]
MKKILVPVDGSAASKKAFEEAVSIAKKYGSEVTLISVVEIESDVAYTEMGIAISGEYAGVRDTLIKIKEESADKLLDTMIKSADCTGITVGKLVRVGSAHPEIVDAACQGKYDLIVMGHRGLNPVKRFFIGSVAKRVIEDAPCSVLIVKE